MWDYPAELVRVIDGDTVELRIDQGFHSFTVQHVRILRVDAPEIGTPEGRAARAYTAAWFLSFANQCVVRTTKAQPRSFVRYLGEITPPGGGESLTDALIRTGHVKPE